MLPPAAARDTIFKALVSYLVSAEDMVDPCGCVFRYIGGQVRFCARIMVRNVAAQMRSASQPHGCLTEHHPYPAGILLPILLLLVVCLFFKKRGKLCMNFVFCCHVQLQSSDPTLSQQNKSQGAQRKTHLVPNISGRKAPKN